MPKCPTPQKVRYSSHQRAYEALKEVRAKGGSIDLFPYKCQCSKWHLGKSQKSLSYRIRKALRKD